MTLTTAIDILVLITALSAAILWLYASSQTLRRLSKTEVIDAADFNRIIVAINRAQILNSRAAIMTALSTLLVAVRYAIGVFGVGAA
jgi:amino acid permease